MDERSNERLPRETGLLVELLLPESIVSSRKESDSLAFLIENRVVFLQEGFTKNREFRIGQREIEQTTVHIRVRLIVLALSHNLSIVQDELNAIRHFHNDFHQNNHLSSFNISYSIRFS